MKAIMSMVVNSEAQKPSNLSKLYYKPRNTSLAVLTFFSKLLAAWLCLSFTLLFLRANLHKNWETLEKQPTLHFCYTH